MEKVLIIIDVQNDFCPGGALAAPEGDKVVPVINQLQKKFDLVAATQDWHPQNHGSFAGNHPGKKIGEVIDLNGLSQILWPEHCVENTRGAEFVSTLEMKGIKVFRKGMDKTVDSYSGFFDNGRKNATGLGDYLKNQGVTDVYIAGLATDYCVKFTVLDALRLGFKTTVIKEACRGVNIQSGDSEAAIEEMKKAGANIR
ncbi:MAG: bifunctional nicotinamidase/pyrazinamidase [Elusimicrobiota bacterium]